MNWLILITLAFLEAAVSTTEATPTSDDGFDAADRFTIELLQSETNYLRKNRTPFGNIGLEMVNVPGDGCCSQHAMVKQLKLHTSIETRQLFASLKKEDANPGIALTKTLIELTRLLSEGNDTGTWGSTLTPQERLTRFRTKVQELTGNNPPAHALEVVDGAFELWNSFSAEHLNFRRDNPARFAYTYKRIELENERREKEDGSWEDVRGDDGEVIQKENTINEESLNDHFLLLLRCLLPEDVVVMVYHQPGGGRWNAFPEPDKEAVRVVPGKIIYLYSSGVHYQSLQKPVPKPPVSPTKTKASWYDPVYVKILLALAGVVILAGIAVGIYFAVTPPTTEEALPVTDIVADIV